MSLTNNTSGNYTTRQLRQLKLPLKIEKLIDISDQDCFVPLMERYMKFTMFEKLEKITKKVLAKYCNLLYNDLRCELIAMKREVATQY